MAKIGMYNIQAGERLGSQMNNFAMLYVIAKKTNHEICIPEFTLHGRYPQTLTSDCFQNILPIETFNNPHAVFIPKGEEDYNYTFNLQHEQDYLFVGLFDHGTLYWAKHIDDIRDNLFVFKEHIYKKSQTLINNIRQKHSNITSVHFRREDYAAFNMALSLDYYKEAIKHIDNTTYVIFSDEIDFCKDIKAEVFGDMEVVFVEGNTQYVDLCMMTLCDNNIVSNSTFGIWGGALNKNKNKKVIAPPQTPGKSEMSRCFKDWIIVH
jgi:hypothetical protein